MQDGKAGLKSRKEIQKKMQKEMTVRNGRYEKHEERE